MCFKEKKKNRWRIILVIFECFLLLEYLIVLRAYMEISNWKSLKEKHISLNVIFTFIKKNNRSRLFKQQIFLSSFTMAWCKYVIISFWGCLVDTVKRLGAGVYNKRKPVIPEYLHSLADLWTCNLLHSVHRRVISECSVQLAGLSKMLSKINKRNINTLPAWLVGKEECFCVPARHLECPITQFPW